MITNKSHFPALDLNLPKVPPRSSVYRLEPINLKKENTEHLISYLNRLSVEHYISPGQLLSCLNVTNSKIDYLNSNKSLTNKFRPGVNVAQRPTTLLGVGKTTRVFLEALTKFTGRTDLKFLTLLPLSEIVSRNYLLRKFKAWCPICYQEMGKEKVFDPIIWVLQEISYCSIHKIKLHTRCNNSDCKKPIKIFSSTSLIDCCPYCSSWLGNYNPENQELIELSVWDYWKTTQLNQIFAVLAHEKKELKNEQLTIIINNIVSELHAGKLGEISRYFGGAPSSFRPYLSGKSRPRLRTLLLLFYRYNLNLTDIFYPLDLNLQTNHTNDIAPYIPSIKVPMIEVTSLIEKVKKEMDQHPPLSLTKVSKNLGHTSISIKKHCPELAKQIKKKNLDYRQNISAERKRNIKNKIKRSILMFIKNNEKPSKHKVALEVGYSQYFRNQTHDNLFDEVMQEIQNS